MTIPSGYLTLSDGRPTARARRKIAPILGLICPLFGGCLAVAEAATDMPAPVAVDGGQALANEPTTTGEDRVYQALGEWNNAGIADGWTFPAAATPTVADGVLTVAEGSAPLAMEIVLTGDGRTDLDLGYNDYLLLRCQHPPGYAGDLTFSFTTTLEADYSAGKVFVIPSSKLVADGNFHEYLVDLGLARRWRGYLVKLRVEPFALAAPAGRLFAIDYLRVGDLASDVLDINTNLGFYTGENLALCSRMLSKHFALWWSPETQRFMDEIAPTLPQFATDAARQRSCLRLCEETYQHFCRALLRHHRQCSG
jgi:hypothetical protein